jgi:hypothetical protein
MPKLLLLFLFLFPFLGMGQSLTLQDSIKIKIPDSYVFYQADIFNSLYFVSREESSLLKYNPNNKTIYLLKGFTPSKKLFIVNPLFIVILDKINKTLDFYDDKLISTQDKIPVLVNQLINPELIYIQDNNLLNYYDEFTTESFVQYNYRIYKNILFSSSLSKEIPANHKYKAIYTSKQTKFLLLQEISQTDAVKNYTVIKQNNQKIIRYTIPNLDYYYWSDHHFYWIYENYLHSYDFENEPEKIKLPEKGESYYIFNRQLFLWKSKVVYLYRLEEN